MSIVNTPPDKEDQIEYKPLRVAAFCIDPEYREAPIILRIEKHTYSFSIELALDISYELTMAAMKYRALEEIHQKELEAKGDPKLWKDIVNGHILYSDHDKNKPSAILDKNGEVVLGLCKVCGAAEAELEEFTCPKPRDKRIFE